MLPSLRVARYTFTLRVEQDMPLPPYKGGVLRGAFGAALRRLTCARPGHGECDDCLLRARCPYAYLFRTPVPHSAEVLRTYSEVPHPFALEPPLDQRPLYHPGEELSFGLVLAGQGILYLPYFLAVFQELGRLGLGPRRARFALEQVHAVHPLQGERTLVYRAADERVEEHDLGAGPAEISAHAAALPAGRVSLRFLTPTRLKYADRYVVRPAFHVLVRRLLSRVSSLAYFHGGERWEADFRGLIARAQDVRAAHMDTRWVDWERYSTRQEARMVLGGFVGQVTYEGDGLGEFLPLLLLGSLVHVGKACTFGHGWYQVEGQD